MSYKLDHIALNCKDLGESVKYCEIISMQKQRPSARSMAKVSASSASAARR